jgi:hypothetical protein
VFEQNCQQVTAFEREVYGLTGGEVFDQLLEYFNFENVGLSQKLIGELYISVITISKGEGIFRRVLIVLSGSVVGNEAI